MSHLIFLYHFLLLKAFYSHYSAILFLSAKSYLSKCSPPDHADGFKVFLAYFLSSFSKILHLLLYDIFFCVFFLFDCEVQLPDLLLKYFPILISFFLFHPVEVVLLLYVSFDLFCLLPCGLADGDISLHY
jgi:hypothetical protein